MYIALLLCHRRGADSHLCLVPWPFHDTDITDIVWCMVLKGGFGGGGRILRNGRAIVLQ